MTTTPTPATRRVRHKKRGSTYSVLGTAELQIAHIPAVEGAELVIYRCEEDGKLWAREFGEFEDGRFEDIAAAPPMSAEVAVKPLVWHGPDADGEHYAEGNAIGGYIIRRYVPRQGFWLTTVGQSFHSVEAAKEAAQTDYETRIRSALSPAPAAKVEELTAEVERLENLIRDNWCGRYWRAVNFEMIDRINAALSSKEESDV
jgi:hypothetical protein